MFVPLLKDQSLEASQIKENYLFLPHAYNHRHHPNYWQEQNYTKDLSMNFSPNELHNIPGYQENYPIRTNRHARRIKSYVQLENLQHIPPSMMQNYPENFQYNYETNRHYNRKAISQEILPPLVQISIPKNNPNTINKIKYREITPNYKLYQSPLNKKPSYNHISNLPSHPKNIEGIPDVWKNDPVYYSIEDQQQLYKKFVSSVMTKLDQHDRALEKIRKSVVDFERDKNRINLQETQNDGDQKLKNAKINNQQSIEQSQLYYSPQKINQHQNMFENFKVSDIQNSIIISNNGPTPLIENRNRSHDRTSKGRAKLVLLKYPITTSPIKKKYNVDESIMDSLEFLDNYQKLNKLPDILLPKQEQSIQIIMDQC